MIATILECFSKTTESWKLWINAVTLCDKRSSKSYNLAFVRKNLCACLLEVISSFCLFREVNLGLQRHFFQGQRGYIVGLYRAACFKIFQVTLNFDSLSKSLESCPM